jgi:hypothetical protein
VIDFKVFYRFWLIGVSFCAGAGPAMKTMVRQDELTTDWAAWLPFDLEQGVKRQCGKFVCGKFGKTGVFSARKKFRKTMLHRKRRRSI